MPLLSFCDPRPPGKGSHSKVQWVMIEGTFKTMDIKGWMGNLLGVEVSDKLVSMRSHYFDVSLELGLGKIYRS